MRAVVIREHGGPEVLKIEDIPAPEPGPGEVQVRVRACALNHLDLWVRRGLPGAPWQLPIVPGADIAGDLSGLGEGVDDIAVGTPVMVLPGTSCGHCPSCVAGADQLCRHYGILGEHGDGGMREFLVVPRSNVVAKPERFTYVQAAAASLTFLTAWHMLVPRAQLRGGETVLIHAAASGVSSAGIQIARYLGAHVIATAGSDDKLETARRLGADHVINYRTEDFVARVKEITGRKGVEVVFDHVGGETFERSLRCMAWAGRLVTCGATTGVKASVNLRHLFFKSQSLLGSTMGSKADYHQLVSLYERGFFEPLVHGVYPMERLAEAHEVLEARAALGKVVITIGPQEDEDG